MRPWKLIKIITLSVVVVGILAYTAFEARGLIAGPTINIDSPMSGETLGERIVMLTGSAERVSRIALNGRDIFISESGVFEEPLTLMPGYNEITLEAWGRFGEHTSQTLQNYFIPTWYNDNIEH